MTMLGAALAFLKAGFTVIPIKLDGSKAPAVARWRHFHQRQPTEDEIKRMFAEPSGLAVLGGQTSGGLTILDFDRPGSFEAWRELLTGLAPGLLERLPVIQTPGGHHVYLRAATCVGNAKLASCEPFTKDGKESRTISETRGQGGYVIAPPSPAEVHPSGRMYAQISGPPLLATPTITEDEHEILLSTARSFNEVAKAAKEDRKTATKPAIPGAVMKPGEDFDERASWHSVLEPHGWEDVRTIGDKTYWRRPGKKDGGISATTGHCGTKLWVFSSSAPPFEAERAYNKFSAFGLLNHGGDYQAAASALRAKGFGSKRQAPSARQQPEPPPSSKWDELDERVPDETSGKPPASHVGMRFIRDPLNGQPATHHRVTSEGVVDEEAPLTDDDAPPELLGPPAERLTAQRLEAMLDDDPAAFMRDGIFERVLAMREDRAEWLLIGDLLRRKKQKSAFNAAVREFDRAKLRRSSPDSWRQKLLWGEDSNGNPYLDKCLSNVIVVLENDPSWDGVLCLDRFSNRIALRRAAPFDRSEQDRWSDADLVETKAWIEREHSIRPSTNDVHDAVVAVARRQAFNPLTDYLDALKERDSDSEGILDTWLIDFFGAADTPLTRAIGAKWMISAVARAYEPGCKVDTVLILEGKQGLKKSRMLKQLCPMPEWFTDGLSEFGSKDQAVEIEGKWIVELAEMKGFGKELDQIKAFVTREAENYRPPYGRNDIHSPRKCIFAATVNPETAGYLRDGTGNRRYWPIECTKQAPELAPETRDQLWAEAKRRYLAKESWWLDDAELLAAAEAEQKKRMVIDPWQDTIEGWLIGKQDTSVTEILSECLKIEIGRRGHNDAIRVGRVLAAIDWIKYRPTRVNGRAQPFRYQDPMAKDLFSHMPGNGHDPNPAPLMWHSGLPR